MIHLNKDHNPADNKKLIDELLAAAPPLDQLTKETETFFNEIRQQPKVELLKRRQPLREKIWAFYSKPISLDIKNYGFQVEGEEIFPEWKNELDGEAENLELKITRQVNVEDFGARGDGRTDCTEAFRKAIGRGRVDVYVPAGTFIVRAVELPSWTRITGKGKGKTVLKLHDRAPKRRRLLTNKDFFVGNRNIAVENMSLDWNVERLGKTEKTAAGNNFSSCLTFANVKFGWVKNVEAINPGLHCFDITSPIYSYAGDGTRARGGSSYVWLDGVSGYGFGDDGFTAHHSDYIFVSNSHFCDPSGRSHKKGTANSNGFEVDDGSRSVWLVNNSSARCFGGVEIKAHGNSSAANSVHISGHLSLNDNRSFNFRHIGHHHADDPESLTAYHITAQRLVSLAPVYTDLYGESTPRSLVVSGYRNVAVNRFLFIGDPNYDYGNHTAAAVQFRARHVSLTNGTIKGFKTAGSDISIAGGEQKADGVLVRGIRSVGSAKKAVAVGDGVEQARVEGISGNWNYKV